MTGMSTGQLLIYKSWKTVNSELEDSESTGKRKLQYWQAELKPDVPKNNSESSGTGQGIIWPDPNENLLASLYCVLISI